METKEDILNFLKNNQEEFKTKYHIKKIGIFGSFANDAQTAESDIDIIIELDENTENIYELKETIRNVIRKKFSRKIDIAREKYLKPYIKRNIFKEVIYAYER